jgi:hypothetical protein
MLPKNLDGIIATLGIMALRYKISVIRDEVGTIKRVTIQHY